MMLHRLRSLGIRAVTNTPFEQLLRSVYERLSRRRGVRDGRLMVEVMRRVLHVDSSGVDVGCYRGGVLHDMLQIAPHGSHFAFEPIAENYEFLLGRFPQATIYRMALSDKSGSTEFHHVTGRPARSGLRRVSYPDPKERVVGVEVELGTLDETIPREATISFVKIDVEGAELEVLRGARRVLSESRPVVVFEHDLDTATAYGTGPLDIHALLVGELGYRISLMERWLDDQPPLTVEDFERCFAEKAEVNFIAYR